jgi:hypothetical protein
VRAPGRKREHEHRKGRDPPRQHTIASRARSHASRITENSPHMQAPVGSSTLDIS